MDIEDSKFGKIAIAIVTVLIFAPFVAGMVGLGVMFSKDIWSDVFSGDRMLPEKRVDR